MQETNAARASHPSRIVIADVLTAVFRLGAFALGAKEHRADALRRMPCIRCSPEACASGLRFDGFHPSRKKDLVGGR